MNLHQVAQFRFRPLSPYNFELTVRKPAGWHWFTPFEVWEKGTIWTGFWFKIENGREGKKIPLGLRARSNRNLISIDLYARAVLGAEDLLRLKERLKRSLGVAEDLKPLYLVMRRHPLLRPLVRRLYGMHEGWGSDIFSSLTLAILLQMAPIKRSQEMWTCLIIRYGSEIKFDRKIIRLWPTEEVIANHSPTELARTCRLGYRAKSLVRFVRQLRAGFPTVEELALMSPEEAKEKLMELYGVGEYSADFATPHPSFSLDVWSVKIFHQLLFGRPAPKNNPRSAIEKTKRAAEKQWGHWRNYIFVYVLNDLPYLKEKFNLSVD